MTRPLILLPGLLNDRRLWGAQAESLADLAEIQVPDLTGADSVAGLARMVLDGAPERFALAGLSMGGYVAQEILRQAPGRVERLALFDTNARADSKEQTERRKSLIAMARGGQFAEVMPMLAPALLHPRHAADPAMCALLGAMAEAVGPTGFERQQLAIMGRPDGRADLSAIRCPTLVACGRQDALTPYDLHKEMADAIPGARLEVIEDAGHLTPIEQPQAVSTLLRTWLQG